MRKISNAIGSVSKYSSMLMGWAIVILVAVVSYDVIARYVLNEPTTWSFIVSYMLGGLIFIVPVAYLMYRDSNVRIDVIYIRFPSKIKLIINTVFDLVFLLPVTFLLARTFVMDAWESYLIKEIAIESPWLPVVWPWKVVITFGFCMMFIQGMIIFINNVITLAKRGGEPW